jgi:preprotein translocase subunit SecY
MWQKLRVVFTIPELRRKIFLTIVLLGVYRVGWQITLPIVDTSKASGLDGNSLGDFVNMAATFSASNLTTMTIFGLGIMPYISASIIFQLLGTVIPFLEKLKEEGEAGRKKINEYTRYATIVICLIQSWAYLSMMSSMFRDSLLRINEDGDAYLPFHWKITAVLTMTAGTAFLMWLGEQIDEYGIGNGISLLIMAGILARMPSALWELLKPIWENGWDGLQLGSGAGNTGVEKILLLAFLFVSVIVGVVFMERGQRQIPTQSAKHTRGRRVYGGTRQYLPLKVNQAGVMPIIFASSLLMIPGVGFMLLQNVWPTADWLGAAGSLFQRGSGFAYNLTYVVLIYFFCYFWTAITFNPKDMAENLKKYGSFIRGHRPGRPTAEYLEKVMVRITYVGAAFLSLVAIIPAILSDLAGIPITVASFYGGTGLLIAVSVAIDLVQKIDSHLVMRNYRGLLED